MSKKIPILTVIYHENIEHFKIAKTTWKSFPEESDIYAVVNKKLKGVDYPDNITYIENDENCLSRAWNKGLKQIFKKYDYCVVSNLDLISPSYDEIIKMKILSEALGVGIVSANCTKGQEESDIKDIKHGDGSFSFFLINKSCFESVGDFDERYKPAYFEDNDYLERCWDHNFTPKMATQVKYYHLFQSTVKFGIEAQKNYPEYMQKNLELFIKTYGRIPDHLPPNIRFKQ